ncbi:MAG TPA: OmpA family protein [Thermoanaerobaculia bacterium]|nr:OmpA family protein [Thermoanaerobaculia bacterium]
MNLKSVASEYLFERFLRQMVLLMLVVFLSVSSFVAARLLKWLPPADHPRSTPALSDNGTGARDSLRNWFSVALKQFMPNERQRREASESLADQFLGAIATHSGEKLVDWLFDSNKKIQTGVVTSIQSCPSVPTQTFSVRFETASAIITGGGRRTLEKLRPLATDTPSVLFAVRGFADTTGSDAYNMDLSLRRARAVETELKRMGIQASRIFLNAYGESNLPVLTANPAREVENRTAEVLVLQGT